MIQKLFTIYDEKARAYLPPFFLGQEAQATRAFSDCVNSKDHQFGAHPTDYTLFSLGNFDDNNASFDTHNPKTLGNGIEFVLDSVQTTRDEYHASKISDEAHLRPDSEGGNSS